MMTTRVALGGASLAKLGSRSLVARPTVTAPAHSFTLAPLASLANKPRYLSQDSTSRLTGKIMGEKSQQLVVDLAPGETIRTAPHSVLRQPLNGVKVESKTTSETILGTFLSPKVEDISNTTSKDMTITLGTVYDDHEVTKVTIDDESDELLCEMRSFLCSSESVKIERARFGSFFGSFLSGYEPWIFHTLSGKGDVAFRGPNLEQVTIGDDEVLRVPTDQVVAFTKSMQFHVSKIKVEHTLEAFVSRKMYVTTITGPGTLWKQSGYSWIHKNPPNTWSDLAMMIAFLFGAHIGAGPGRYY